MMKKQPTIFRAFLLVVLCAVSTLCFSQNPTEDDLPDPGATAVSTIQGMKFGAFSLGSGGGSVQVSNSGARSFTGAVVLLNLGVLFCQAIFDVEAPIGTIISVLNGPDAVLVGSNGGSILLHLSDSDPVSPFNSMVMPPGRTQVSVGGSVTVGDPSIAVAGAYSGIFYITFNNE